MTIREAVSVLSNAKNIFIAWRGGIVEINPNDSLMMSALAGTRSRRFVIHGRKILLKFMLTLFR